MAAVSSPKSTILQLKESSCSVLGGSLKGISLPLKPRNKRTSLVVAAASNSNAPTTSSSKGSRFYLNFTGFPFPLGPFLNRRTIRTEVTFFTSKPNNFIPFYVQY